MRLSFRLCISNNHTTIFPQRNLFTQATPQYYKVWRPQYASVTPLEILAGF
jgi:hypothetical protein